MKTAKINLYEVSELDQEAKEKALEEHRKFLLETTFPSEFDYDGDYESTIKEIENDDEYVIENIKSNEYLYFSDGDLAWTTQYTGTHPKAGKTVIQLGNDIYEVTT